MIQISPTTPIFLHSSYVDFRKGIDGLCGVCKYEMQKDPLEGAMFAFCSRNKKALKILVYDSQGFWVFHKRLSTGKFNWWPSSKTIYVEVAARELHVLIWNGNPTKIKMQKEWKKVSQKRKTD